MTWRPSAVAYTQAGLDAIMGARVRPVMLRIHSDPGAVLVLVLRRTWWPIGVTVVDHSSVDVLAPYGSNATVSVIDDARAVVAGSVLVGAHGRASIIASTGARVSVQDGATCVRQDATVAAHLASERGLILDTFPED